MNPIGYILAAIAGALVAGAANVIVELIKRRNDRRGAASAIADEISGIVWSAEKRLLPDYFRDLVPKLKSGAAPPPPWFYYDSEHKPTPILDAHLDRIGCLGGRLPERIAQFHARYQAVRHDLKIIASGQLDTHPSK
jgi:hypothetical protein